MRSLLFLALFAGALFGAEAHAVPTEALVNSLKKAAKQGSGITVNEQKIAKKVQARGAAAIPYLLALLRDENKEVRDLASYTLRDQVGLTEEHLDALIDSRMRGDGWIPPAIAHIGSPRAIQFLIDEFLRERNTQTQLTWALGILGAKAVPPLVRIFQTEAGWDADLEGAMRSVFREFGEKAESAVQPLLVLANDEAEPATKRIRAIAVLGAIGLPAQAAVPDLLKLREHHELAIRDAAKDAILGIGTAEAVPILLELLDEQSARAEKQTHVLGSGLILSDIAALGNRGTSAGATVVRYLSDADWEMRVSAARTLGYIGYREAAGELIAALKNEEDWRLVFCAAESLGKLGMEQAIPELKKFSANHWSPPVRQASLQAIKAIGGSRGEPLQDASDDVRSEFFRYADTTVMRLSGARKPTRTIHVPIKQAGANLHLEQRAGIKVEDGYLLNTDLGEWGGGVTFVDLDGNSHEVLNSNTEAIYQTAHGVVAVTGIAHLSLNEGSLYKLSQTDGKAWTAERWRVLPGAPQFSRMLRDGKLFVACYGGVVTIAPDGGMKSLTRAQALDVYRR